MSENESEAGDKRNTRQPRFSLCLLAICIITWERPLLLPTETMKGGKKAEPIPDMLRRYCRSFTTRTNNFFRHIPTETAPHIACHSKEELDIQSQQKQLINRHTLETRYHNIEHAFCCYKEVEKILRNSLWMAAHFLWGNLRLIQTAKCKQAQGLSPLPNLIFVMKNMRPYIFFLIYKLAFNLTLTVNIYFRINL